MTKFYSVMERIDKQRLEDRRFAESALFKQAMKLTRQGIRYDDVAQVALELARMLHNLRRFPNEQAEADEAFAEHVRRFLHRMPKKRVKRPSSAAERPEQGTMMITKADGTQQTVRYYRLGVHYVRITYEGEMPVQCERFDNETCKMVRDWSMLMRIEKSLEVDRIGCGEFVLYRLRKKAEHRI